MATLRVKDQGSGPRIYARWRHDGRMVERPIGAGWLVRDGDAGAKPNGRTIGAWRERRGRAPEGFYDVQAATQAIPGVMEAWRATQTLDPVQAAAARLRAQALALEDQARRLEGDRVVTFKQAAEAWFAHRRDVKRVKASTLRSYRSDLDARILPPLGPVPLNTLGLAHLTSFRDDLAALRDEDDEPGLTPRTINKYLTVIGGILGHACRPVEAGGFGLPSNPAQHVDKLGETREDDTDYLSPAEIVAVASALRRGAHRDRDGIMPAGGAHAQDVHRLAREADDARDAAAVLIAGFTGLRRGEVVGLRWGDVSLTDERIDVRRAIVLGREVTPKGGRSRTVPMAGQVAQALAELDAARRAHAEAAGIPAALGDDAPVLGTALGDPLDASALVRRYKRACESVGMRVVRWHGLRHSFVTAAREGFTADRVQQFAGHEDPRTAARYAHARSAADDAARLTTLLETQTSPSQPVLPH
jgi:integrase